MFVLVLLEACNKLLLSNELQCSLGHTAKNSEWGE